MFIEDKNLLATTTNFQIFMMIMAEKAAKEKKDAVKALCSLLFPEYNVLFTPKSFLLQKEDNSIVIDETNFEKL
jgi:hypothetical protein